MKWIESTILQRALEVSKTFDPIIAFKGLGESCTFWTSSSGRGGYPMFIFLRNDKDEERDFILVDYTENHHSGNSIRLIKES